MSRHRRRSLVLALAGVVLAVLGLSRLGAGGDGHVPAGRRVTRVVALRPLPCGMDRRLGHPPPAGKLRERGTTRGAG